MGLFSCNYIQKTVRWIIDIDMVKKQHLQKKKGFILLGIIGMSLFLTIFVLWKGAQIEETLQDNKDKTSIEVIGQYESYISQDLQISFKHPNGWYIHEKDRSIMITSYPTKIGDNSRPNVSQTKIFIGEWGGGCYKTIEENLKNPACGRGRQDLPNEILSKKVIASPEGIYSKYEVLNPSTSNKFTFRFFEQKDTDRILQISKEPDPSEFDKEFEAIIRSIKFLP